MEDTREISVHVLVCDGPQAYGGIAYLRNVINCRKIEINFLICKIKFGPLKSLISARSYLMTTLLSTCSENYVQRVFPSFTQSLFGVTP